jgi:outer membrane receptor protein involved in Fe transport
MHVVLNLENRATVTDSKGFYRITHVPPGTYTISFSHIRYKSRMVKNVRINPSQTLQWETLTFEYNVLELDGVSVTAARNHRTVTEVAQPVNIVTELRIRERNAKTSAEALREETGVFVQKTGHGGGSAIIRGLSSNQILILVDGIRLNNATYRLGNHQYLTTIDNQSADQIEVVRGPTSVLYGSDAMGGTINVLTRTPRLNSDGLHLGYRILGRFATADREKTARTEINLGDKAWALTAGFSYKDYGDLRRGGKSYDPVLERSTNGLIQTPTGFSAANFDTKLRVKPDAGQEIILAYQMTRKRHIPRYDKYENDGYYRWFYHPQNRDLVYLTWDNTLNSKGLARFKATVSYHRQEEGRETQKSAESLLTVENHDVSTLGTSLQIQAVLGKHLLTGGAELYSDWVQSGRIYKDPSTGLEEMDSRGRYPDDSRYTRAGFYLQNEISVSRRITATAGARASLFDTRFTLPPDTSSPLQLGAIHEQFHSLTGSLGLICRLSRHLFLNMNAGQAFRAPNLSDMSKLGESKGSTYEVPNPDLEPEKMVNLDAGLKVDAPRWKANTAVYYARIFDLLASSPSLYNGSPTIERGETVYQVKAKMNIGEAYIWGVEMFSEWLLTSALSLSCNFSYTFGRNTTQHEPVGGIPPLFGMVGMRWRGKGFSAHAYTRFAARQDRLSADDLDDPRIPEGGTPGWYTLNLRLGIEAVRGIYLQASVENILDRNYREHGSGVNGPGRNFVLALELRN